MGKLLKVLGGILAVLVLLVVGAAILIPLLVDPNDFKGEITARVKQATGRDLRIDGNIGLSVFPWLGVELGGVTLSNAPGFGDQPFAAVKSARVRAKLLPLLSRRLEVDRVRAEGVRLGLIRDPGGRTNWEDLAGKAPAEAIPTEKTTPPKPEEAALAALAIGGVELADAELVWDDRQAGQRLALNGIDLKTGAIEPGRPLDVQLAFNLDNTQPAVQARVEVTGTVHPGASLHQIQVKPLRIGVTDLKTGAGLRGRAELQTELNLDLEAQKLSAKPLRLALSELQTADKLKASAELTAGVTGDLAAQAYRIEDLKLTAEAASDRLPGGRIKVDAASAIQLDLAKQTLSTDEIRVRSGLLQLTGKLEGRQIQTAPVLSGSLALAELNLGEWLKQSGIPVPETADPGVLQRVSLSSGWRLAQDQIKLEGLKARLDDSSLQGSAAVVHLAKPGYRFELDLDRIDLDRYLPPVPQGDKPTSQPAGAPGKAGPPVPLIPVDLVRDLDLDGRLSVGELTVSKLRIQKAVISVKARDGQLNLDNQVNQFYQGNLKGRIGLDARGKTPKLNLDQQAAGIQAGPLLKDVTGEDRLTGRGQLNARLSTQGDTEEAARRNLNGDLSFDFRDGAVKGFNLAQMIREAKATLRGEPRPPSEGPVQTDFSELSFKATAQNGVLHDDLDAKSPYLRVTGIGQIDLAAETLDYLVKPVVVSTAKGAGGKGLEELKGVPIPVYLTGPWSDPKWRIDIASAAAEVGKAKLQEKIEQKEGETLEKLDKKLEEKTGVKGLGEGLRGLFGR